MTPRARLLLGLIALVLSTALAVAAEEAPPTQAAVSPAPTSAQECKTSEPVRQEQAPTARPAAAAPRAADIEPMSWGNVKALWG